MEIEKLKKDIIPVTWFVSLKNEREERRKMMRKLKNWLSILLLFPQRDKEELLLGVLKIYFLGSLEKRVSFQGIRIILYWYQ